VYDTVEGEATTKWTGLKKAQRELEMQRWARWKIMDMMRGYMGVVPMMTVDTAGIAQSVPKPEWLVIQFKEK
jgi:hypothetical protein